MEKRNTFSKYSLWICPQSEPMYEHRKALKLFGLVLWRSRPVWAVIETSHGDVTGYSQVSRGQQDPISGLARTDELGENT